ncbi:MAG: beta-lactamase family protein [Halieaceae bacterium]|jgi:CubicO group peptidase (beta-lactamase class C family)|nr:beta-lactamase family protein [Halieaceae bacterium]
MTEFANYLDTYVPAKLGELNLPGAAIGLIENAQLVATRSYGFADRAAQKPLTENTLFQIASISKSVATWGIMTLVEQGKLDLDAPVSQYLTRWQLPESKFDNSAVTARLLLMHFAGTSLSGCGGTPYDKRWYTVDDILYGRTPPLDDRQEAYARQWKMDPDQYSKPVHLLHEPGTKFEYSGGGFSILELIIEELSGKDFTSYMNDEVLNPLGMNESSFEVQEEQLPNVAVPYNDALEAMPLYRINGKAAGGMYSSIVELSKFACAEMTGPAGEAPGRGILLPESVAEMHRPDRYAETDMGMDFYTGLGHYVVNMGDIQAVQHTGGNPGWRTVYTIVPEKKLGFVCLINSAGGNDLWMDLIMQWAESAL